MSLSKEALYRAADRAEQGLVFGCPSSAAAEVDGIGQEEAFKCLEGLWNNDRNNLGLTFRDAIENNMNDRVASCFRAAATLTDE